MSYMNQADFAPAAGIQFAPAGGIQELSFDEVDLVDGAKLSAGVKLGLRIAGRVALGAGLAGLAVGIAVEAYIYYNS